MKSLLPLFCLFINLCPLLPAGTSEPPVIKEVRVEGAVSITKETILFYLQLQEGDPYDPARVQKNFRQLVKSQLFSDARISMEEEEDGVILIVKVEERPILKEIDYEGNKALSDSQIREKFTNKKIRFRVDMPIREDIVQKAAAVIEDSYKEMGYPNTRVETVIEDMGNQNRRVTFRIDEGTKLRIIEVLFKGNEVFSSKKLRGVLKKTKKWNWISAVTKDGIYNPENQNEDIENLKSFYLRHGYKDIKIGEIKLEIVDLGEGKKRGVALTFPIEEGPQFRIRNVRLEGSTVYPADVLMKQIKFATGDILNFQQLKDAQEGVAELYSTRGYLFARIVPTFTPVEGDENLLDVLLTMDEGDQYRLGRVEFSGNTRTMDKVLRREFYVFEAGVFNASSFRRSIYKMNQLGFFKLDEEKPVDFSFDAENKSVDVVVNGREAARNDIQFSFGYSELDGFFGQFYFNTRNLMGRGETLTVGYQNGRRTDYYELMYASPWFLDKPHLFTSSLYSRSLDYYSFDRETEGLSLGYGIRLGIFSNVSLVYNYEFINAVWADEYKYDEDEEGNLVENPFYQDVDTEVSSITPIFRYDGRDDPFDPFRGMAMKGSVKFAGGAMGGKVDFIKPQYEFTLYRPTTRKHTFAMHAEIGYLFFDDVKERQIFYERYFLGGERTLRGFQTRSVRPEKWVVECDDEGNCKDVLEIIGGDRFYLFNFESIWRLQGPFRFVLFFDAGQAFGEWEKFELMEFRTSVGAELRIFLPMFMAPLRFIYGINLNPLQGESRSDFQFTIGTNF